MEKKINLPEFLKPFETDLLSTQTEYVKVSTKVATDLVWWESRIGGQPYLPEIFSYPKSDEGKPLFFLAQINFEEVPTLANFPKKGILQFYISDGGNYGASLDTEIGQADFRLLYFPDPIKDKKELHTEFSPFSQFHDVPLSSGKSYQMKFEKQYEIAPTTDHHFDKKMGGDFFMKFGEKEWDRKAEYDEVISAASHKVGGYAHFTQDDPRMYKNKSSLLLFQLDSDPEIGCQWGDMGIAHFFIEPEDLIAKDFSKVTFNWDSL